jgi:hypothetical protein
MVTKLGGQNSARSYGVPLGNLWPESRHVVFVRLFFSLNILEDFGQIKVELRSISFPDCPNFIDDFIA